MEETRVEVGRPRGAGKPRKLAPQRRQRNLWFAIPAVVGIVTIFAYAATGWPRADSEPGHGRMTQSADFCTKPGPAQLQGSYPPELFSGAALCNGAWVIYLVGSLYMFLALSIVCDEFFVPALEVIVERTKIADDVAGATFMAAGGSAPEFFTAVIGTFLSESNVGFGTIVGSAVFNVLFVIGCCAMFSKEVLSLTWWPLARDSVYYSITLAALVIFFLDSKIEWWEALIQFLLYIGYVTVMAYNVPLYKCTSRCFGARDSSAVSPAPMAEPGAAGFSDRPARRGSVIDRANAAAGVTSARATFHAHVLHMMFYETDPRGKGPNKEADGRFSRAVKIVMERTKAHSEEKAGIKPGNAALLRAAARAAGKGDTQDAASDAGGVAKDVSPLSPDEEEPKVTTSTGGQARAAAAETSGPSKHGSTGGTVVPSPSAKQGKQAKPADDEDKSAAVMGAADEDGDDDDEDPGDEGTVEDMLRWPHSTAGRIWYVAAAPLTYSLAYTVPDVRVKGREGWYPVTFFMSILWIALFSYLMVWWATVIGATLFIPESIMGLTFLAAGTSVPDLLTSVLVARQGLGDMAVSSSIGSNIFDVTVGLPVPWLIATLVRAAPVAVVSKGLRFSVFLLFCMLAVVIISILLSGWRLSTGLGIAMFLLYGVFVAISLLIELGPLEAPF
ncbi:hypothetical protein FNF29_05032 [Cafeteria roenbergensis]|uniref:Sodium/calcium exchanger membrane region domain-containing protein n=1 Tax=Cafeteria roenbergensis TaxID=33653 RepID=A0A5A8CCM9_CAFRO|nr:hypothetical protein FNF29_05032 [Cafeteria roenbergensis]KAA0162259.1 hypothetical protein FNF31_03301 [Cafeteria roenbergensis]|eukprot:KAA0150695.1 hypothetical protein FNF29_05032 [Cafeteria roenbergensis]